MQPATPRKLRPVICLVASLSVGWFILGTDPFTARTMGEEILSARDRVDLRPIFERWRLTPRQQGGRGTCSVFAVTGAMEYALSDKSKPPTRLSVEFLNWASNQVIGRADDGGFFSDLWRGYESFGICEEAKMPYSSTFDPTGQPSQAALKNAETIRAQHLQLHWIKPWDPHQGLTDEQFDRVKETLRRKWPVCGGFLWPKQPEWIEGVLQMAPREGVRDGHSVLLVGYQDDGDQPGGGIFLVRNSGAGPDFPAMSYEYVRTYMNDAVWIGHPQGPPTP
jgi:hypothetical protein